MQSGRYAQQFNVVSDAFEIDRKILHKIVSPGLYHESQALGTSPNHGEALVRGLFKWFNSPERVMVLIQHGVEPSNHRSLDPPNLPTASSQILSNE